MGACIALASPEEGVGAGVGCGPVVQIDVTFDVDDVTCLLTDETTSVTDAAKLQDEVNMLPAVQSML